MNDISSRYDKEVVAAEIAYAYTTNNYDNMRNIFTSSTVDMGGYKATVQGQATAIRNIMDAVSQVSDNKGLRVFYWEPDWIALSAVQAGLQEKEMHGKIKPGGTRMAIRWNLSGPID